MKQWMLGGLLSLCLLAGPSYAVDHVHYGRQQLTGPKETRPFPDKWDLTKCDLVIKYGIDLTAYFPSHYGGTLVGAVGLQGLGGLVSTSVEAFTTDPTKFDRDDLHVLSASPISPFNYLTYNAPNPNTIGPAFGTDFTYGFWYDRDGVAPAFAARWGSVDGGNYNTGGLYWVELRYHAISPTQATVFATINGIQQGFYIGTFQNAQPDIYPAGRGLTGDVTNANVYIDLGTIDGGKFNLLIRELDVTGCLATARAPIQPAAPVPCRNVRIDILPGITPNLIIQGPFPVVIYGNDFVDAPFLDPSKIFLCGAPVVKNAQGQYRTQVVNLDNNAHDDLLVWFGKDKTEGFCGATALLQADMNGQCVTGSDTIQFGPKVTTTTLSTTKYASKGARGR